MVARPIRIELGKLQNDISMLAKELERELNALKVKDGNLIALTLITDNVLYGARFASFIAVFDDSSDFGVGASGKYFPGELDR